MCSFLSTFHDAVEDNPPMAVSPSKFTRKVTSVPARNNRKLRGTDPHTRIRLFRIRFTPNLQNLWESSPSVRTRTPTPVVYKSKGRRVHGVNNWYIHGGTLKSLLKMEYRDYVRERRWFHGSSTSFYFFNKTSSRFPSIPNYMFLPTIVFCVYRIPSLDIQTVYNTNCQDT